MKRVNVFLGLVMLVMILSGCSNESSNTKEERTLRTNRVYG